MDSFGLSHPMLHCLFRRCCHLHRRRNIIYLCRRCHPHRRLRLRWALFDRWGLFDTAHDVLEFAARATNTKGDHRTLCQIRHLTGREIANADTRLVEASVGKAECVGVVVEADLRVIGGHQQLVHAAANKLHVCTLAAADE
jgi:hypothetical protein